MRLIFPILFWPFNRLYDLLFQKRDNLVEYYFKYDAFLCYVETRHKPGVLSDELLIASFIFFLSRYFYICDDRQIISVRKHLLEEIRDRDGNFYEITGGISSVAYGILNQQERSAVSKIFPMGPPFLYSEENDKAGRILGRYSFLISERQGKFLATFHMSLGPDIVLLPITAGIMYEFVNQQLQDKTKREVLKRAAIELLQSHETESCRSLRALVELPKEILLKNNITLKPTELAT